MSRTSTNAATNDEKVETVEVKETTKTAETKTTVATMEVAARTTVAPTTKMGITRWLQLHPQTATIEGMLKKKYKTTIKTHAEWNQIVGDLLGITIE